MQHEYTMPIKDEERHQGVKDPDISGYMNFGYYDEKRASFSKTGCQEDLYRYMTEIVGDIPQGEIFIDLGCGRGQGNLFLS